MKYNQSIKRIYLLGFIFLFISQVVFSQDENKFVFPEPIGFVNDFEGVFTKDQVDELTKIIQNHEKKTSNEIFIVTIESYKPYKTLFKYSLDLGNLWGIGKKDKNNGVMIVFGKQIREIRIQVGYGLEKKLQDDEAKKIIDDTIIPEFKKNDYYSGIKKGLLKIINEIE